jgi:hypothetical protein
MTEISIGGVYLAPIVVYAIAAALIFVVLRFILGHAGVLRRVWHPALFEVALFLCVLSLLVRYF